MIFGTKRKLPTFMIQWQTSDGRQIMGFTEEAIKDLVEKFGENGVYTAFVGEPSKVVITAFRENLTITQKAAKLLSDRTRPFRVRLANWLTRSE